MILMGINGEGVARAVQQGVESASRDSSYVIGNLTQRAFGEGNIVTKLTRSGATIETGKSLGLNAFKAFEDASENDQLCTGLCLVACLCEVIAGGSALLPYSGALKVYTVTKSISYGCINFRDKCREAKGKGKSTLPGC